MTEKNFSKSAEKKIILTSENDVDVKNKIERKPIRNCQINEH